MKFIKKASVVALSVLSMNMAQAYTETGKLQCYATDEFKNKDTVVLFVNGITNDLTQAENSRQILSESYSCPECDFRKSFNRTEGQWNDIRELSIVSALEIYALREAGQDVLNELQTLIDNTIQKQYNHLIDTDVVIINNHKITIKELKEINKTVFDEMIKKQKYGYVDNDDLFFNPEKDGTRFDTAFDNFLKNSTSTNWFSSSEKKAYESFSNAVFAKQKGYLEKQFFFKYKEYLAEQYLSHFNFYKNNNGLTESIRKAVEHLQNNITEFVLAGKKVVIVAHSQGNHLIELVYAKLQAEKGLHSSFMNAIRVVGIAPVSSTTPNNAYITSDDDGVVFNLYDSISLADPLKPNFTDTTGFKPINSHSFATLLSKEYKGKYAIPNNIHSIDVHPNDIKDSNREISALNVVQSLITGAKNSAKAIPAQITTNSLLTAQLRWEDYDDMDLYIHEPPKPPLFSKTQVYYGNKTGRFGYLDLDDTNGDGPEHYYINPNTSCHDLSNKTWDFYIHQHPNGGFKATAHFMLKLGNNRVTSHSFAKETWTKNKPDIYVPSSILNRPSVAVTFAPYTAGSPTLDYTIKVTNSVTNLDGGENNNN